jgi:hypothetical protein
MQLSLPGHGAVNGAAPAIAIGPVKVEFPGLAKSTWNLQRFNAPESGSMFARKFGEPAGGDVDPSDPKAKGSRLKAELKVLRTERPAAQQISAIPAHASAQ